MTPTTSSPPIGAAPEARLVTPYAPRLLIQRLAERPEALVEDVDGTIVFVDISGFTRLSERLASKGRVGAEELTEAIESCFTALLALAYENGGSLIKFGGDALLLFFTGEDHGPRACRSAVWMRRALREIGKLETSGGKVNLRMSVGVHSGSFQFFLVGGSHREFIIAGPAASRTVAMEHTAEAGEIMVSHATAALLPERVLGSDRGAGRLLRRAPDGRIEQPVERELSADPAELLRCIPLAIRDHLLAGIQEPEHRRATVAFLRFDGTDELIRAQGGAAVAESLDELIGDVQREVDSREICFLGTDVDEDGGKIILTAGVPSGTGNDEERMLLALRAIATRPRTLPLRIGVHRGPVFAGDIGPHYRRTYTVMGDTVNMAARLMANATPGELLATPDVLHPSNTCFSVQALEPFNVKGKSLPVQAYAVGDAAGTRARVDTVHVPLMGRGSEMAALRAALEEVRNGEGRLVEIIGEPGIGKSRLVAELESESDDLVRLSVRCELYRSSTPYAPVRRLLEGLLEIDEGTEDVQALERLTTIVASSTPELLPWLPLLGIPLDLEATATPETKALDERFRRERLEEVVGELLHALLPAPTLIVIEDAHWMDEASGDLLRHLTTSLRGMPWLVCVTRRAEGTGFHAPEQARGITMQPAPLDEADCIALLEFLTADQPLSPHDTLALARRSGGNPLLVRELLSATQAAGSIDGLPDSVESLMTSRIDRLTTSDRMLLRRAAVLGASFSTRLLADLLDDETPPPSEDDWHRLAEFVELRTDGTVAFRRSLIRDAAYEGLPFRLRRELHARAGEALERSVADAVEEAELLSLHFFHARRLEPAWRFSLVAGHRARAKFAPVEAAEFYQRAVDAARGLPDVAGEELADVYEALGDVRDRAGSYKEAGNAYRAARRLLSGDPVREAQLLLKHAWIPEREGRYSQAIRWIGKGLRTLEQAPSADAGRQRAQLYVWQAAVRQLQGRSADAIRWCSRAIEEAERSGDRDALAHAYYVLDWAYAELGRFDEAIHSERALEIYGELGDLAGQAAVYNNLGGFAYFQGRWDEALRLYERAREARERVGDPVNAAMATLNVGEILSDQARFDEAERCFHEALRVWRAAAHQEGVAFATGFLGRVASRRGEFEKAMGLFREARALFAETGAKGEVIETDALIAECLALQGAFDDAFALASDALARGGGTGGQTQYAPLLRRIIGCALVWRGDLTAAVENFDDALEIARARSAAFEVAQTLEVFAAADRLCGREEQASKRTAEWEDVYSRLGVRRRPPIPWPKAVGEFRTMDRISGERTSGPNPAAAGT